MGSDAKVAGVSAVGIQQFNTEECYRRLLSREPILERVIEKGEELRGCHVREGDSPWIQIELKDERILMGLQVETLMNVGQTEHLTVWASEDGKKWREVAKAEWVRKRYRFDLNRKNVKAKFLRIGREPGCRKDDAFGLHKVLIYGK